MRIYKRYTNKPYSFLANENLLPSDHPLTFRKGLTNKTYFITKINNNHGNQEKNWGSFKNVWIITEKYQYFIGEEILPSDQSALREQVFILFSQAYSQLWNRFGKWVKTIEDQGETQGRNIEEHGKNKSRC